MTGITGSGSYGSRGINGAMRADRVELGVSGGVIDMNASSLDDVTGIGVQGSNYVELGPGDETFRVVKTMAFDRQVVTTTPFDLEDGDPPIVIVDTDTIGGAAVVNLPATGSGGMWLIQVIGSGGTVTIDGDGSEEINGALTLVLAAEDDAALIINTRQSSHQWSAFVTP